jgi:hypothetical protein
MRQGQQNNNKRMRGRSRKGPNPLTRSYESNGGDVKIRGTALHVAEKYVQLARDAQSSGDRVAGENYLQHAEHYYRIVAAAQAQMPQPQQAFRSDEEGDDEEGFDNRGGGDGHFPSDNFGGNRQQMQGGQPGQPGYDPQPPVSSVATGNNGGPANNGGGPDQARYPDQPGDQRFEPRTEGFDNRDRGQGGGYGNQGGGGNFRHRRRRPYRDHYNDRGGEQRGQSGQGGQGAQGGSPDQVDTGPERQGDE